MTSDYENFRRALYELYMTPQGKLVIDSLEMSYVDFNVFNVDTNTTMYRLGQKELVQSLVSDAKTKYEHTQEIIED